LETVVKKLYEAMFLVDSAKAASDWESVNKTIKTIFKKAQAEVVSIRKWDERILAYQIEGKSRGTYILTYFRASGDNISGIEREVQLSEQLMRVLILNAEHLTDEDINKETPAMRAARKVSQAAQKAEEPEEEVTAVNTVETDLEQQQENNIEDNDEADAEIIQKQTKSRKVPAPQPEETEADEKEDVVSDLETRQEEIN